MNRKTLFPTIATLALAGLAVVACLNSAYSEDERSTVRPPAANTNPLDRKQKPSLRELHTEIVALRADMQKVLALLTPEQTSAPPQPAEIPNVEVTEKVSIFPLEFVPAESVAEVIQNVVLTARVSVLHDENRLVVVGSGADVERAAQTIEQIDRPRPQVRVESYLYEIAIDDLAELGLQGDDLAEGAIRLHEHFDLKTAIGVLSESEGARLLARPNIRAYDRTTATFESVQEIPVQALTQTAEGANIGTTEFREAGITMEVTPRITSSGKIIMEVQPEFSVMRGFVDGQPVIDRRAATSTVVVRDGEPIVISGLRSQRQQFENDQVEPVARETELLIIMKAEIVKDHDE